MQGFTLLEVLVSVVVLSFGVLGVVGLQASALQSNRDARYQSSAARLARELTDMMRDNPTVAAASGNPYLGSFDYTSFSPNTVAANCVTTACTLNGTALAKFNMADWLTRLFAELPDAKVVVCFDSAPYTSSGQGQWGCTAGTGAPIYVKIGWARQGFAASAAAVSASNAAPAIVQSFVP